MGVTADIPLPFNPDMFRWARERLAIPIAESARKVSVPESKVHEWENGTSVPTARQGRMLAEIYNRHFLEFFAPTAPVLHDVKLVPDFRSFSGHQKTEQDTVALTIVQEWAEEMRENSLSLIDLIGERPPVLSSNLKFATSDDVDTAAMVVREAISFPIYQQTKLKVSEAYTLPTIIRRKIEQMGILVLKQGSITKLGVRGICLFAEPLPTIIFGNEAASAQAFTLIHELGHVLLGQSGISGSPQFREGNISGGRAIESWCSRFAAAFLIPSDALATFVKPPAEAADDFRLDLLAELSKAFSVSRHAMLIRLVDLHYVKPSFYWKKMRPIFTKEEEEHDSFGRPSYYGKRYVSSHGEFYTGLVLEAWGRGQISAHNAAEFMGIKNLKHLIEIREDFRA